ncbi:MAG: hypothetical protein JXR37_23910 [Kiritimatiellae bacterium]|nr:hypothetical protein [Kiritimatiellia bacterium]
MNFRTAACALLAFGSLTVTYAQYQENGQSYMNRQPDSSLAVGDPICAANGAFSWEKTLLDLGGPMDLHFTLTYQSDPDLMYWARLPQDFPWHMGGWPAWGWNPAPVGRLASFPFVAARFLLADNTSLCFTTNSLGQWELFSYTGDSTTENGIPGWYELCQQDEWFYMNDSAGGQVYMFEQVTNWVVLRVRYVRDRNGNTLSYDYATPTNFNPSAISDGLGRRIDLLYSDEPDWSQNFLTNVADHAGRAWSFSFTTNAPDNNYWWTFRSMTDPAGGMHTFGYEYHQYSYTNSYGDPVNATSWVDLLTTLVEPAGNMPVSNEYAMVRLATLEPSPRVVRQTDGAGFQTTLSYTNNADTNYVVTVTYPDAAVEAYTHYSHHSLPKAVSDGAGNTIQFGKNTNELCTSIADRLGGQTSFAYEEDRGLLIGLTNAAGGLLALQYGTVTQSFANPATSHVVDLTFAQVTQATFADASTEQYVYDSAGNITARVDRAGHTWTWTYNAMGLPLTAREPGGSEVTYTWTTNGTLASVQDADGGQLTYGYDAWFRVTSISNSEGGMRQMAYDAFDRLTNEVDELGNATAWEYDANGNLVRTTDALGHAAEWQYDTLNRVTNTSDSVGQRGACAYDNRGRPAVLTDALGIRDTLAYDARGWPTNRARETLCWNVGFDAEGLPVAATMPDGSSRQTQLDALGRPTNVVDEAGQSWAFTRDALGHLTGMTDPAGAGTTIAYDARGLATSVTHAVTGTASLRRDERGRTTEYVDATGRYWTFGYSDMGRLIAVTNPLGYAATCSYDTLGRLTSVAGPDGTIEGFLYDAAGRQVRRRDARTNDWWFAYDALDRVVAVTNPLGGVVQYTYGPDGALASVSDSDIGAVSNAYDAARRPTARHCPDGGSSACEYDPTNGLPSAILDANGNRWTFAYTPAGNPARLDNPLGGSTFWAYDSAGRETNEIDALGNSTDREYDALGREILTRLPDGFTVSNAYDAAGRLTHTTLGGQTWQYAYDNENRLLSEQTPMGHLVQYQRDPLGQLTGVVNALNQHAALSYDPAGRLLAVSDPMGRTASNAYDSAGQLIGVTRPGGAAAQYARNALGLVEHAADLNGNVWTFGYTSMGRLLCATNPLGRATLFSYDEAGRIDRVDYADGSWQDIAYDPAGNATSCTYSASPALVFSYDAMNRLIDTDGLSFQRDTLGRVTNTLQNGVAYGAAYDVNGRLSAATYHDGALTATYAYNSTNGLLAGVQDSLAGGWVSFEYDADGRLTHITRANGVNGSRTWDDAGRLTRLLETNAAGVLIDLQYALNRAGQVTNLAAAVPLPAGPNLPGTATARVYDAAAREADAGYAYDALGRRTNAPAGVCVWDGASRLTALDAVAFSYNGLGDLQTRVESGTTQRFFYNHAAGLAPLMTERDDTAGQNLRYYVWTPEGRLLYMIDAADGNKPYYFLFDRTGSTLALTDSAGQITDACAVDPYGRLLACTGTNAQPFAFVGEWGVRREGTNGLYHARARYYDAGTARFISFEPHWPRLHDPRLINPYAYALGDPVQFADVDGSDPVPVSVGPLGGNVNAANPASPFGAIDTPASGGLAPTRIRGTGWALDLHSAQTITVPSSGSLAPTPINVTGWALDLHSAQTITIPSPPNVPPAGGPLDGVLLLTSFLPNGGTTVFTMPGLPHAFAQQVGRRQAPNKPAVATKTVEKPRKTRPRTLKRARIEVSGQEMEAMRSRIIADDHALFRQDVARLRLKRALAKLALLDPKLAKQLELAGRGMGLDPQTDPYASGKAIPEDAPIPIAAKGRFAVKFAKKSVCGGILRKLIKAGLQWEGNPPPGPLVPDGDALGLNRLQQWRLLQVMNLEAFSDWVEQLLHGIEHQQWADAQKAKALEAGAQFQMEGGNKNLVQGLWVHADKGWMFFPEAAVVCSDIAGYGWAMIDFEGEGVKISNVTEVEPGMGPNW